MQLRERRVAQHAVHGKHYAVANLAGDAVVVAFGAEITRQARVRNVRGDCGGIHTFAGSRESALVEVGGEHDQLAVQVTARDLLAEQDRERVRFLAGSAARHPNADRLIRLEMIEQRRDDLRSQRFPRDRVAKKSRDRNQQIIE